MKVSGHGRGRRLPEVLTEEELGGLIKQPNRRYPTGRRNAAMLAIMADAGLRVGETLSLHPGAISWNSGRIKIRGKGGKDRFVWVGEGTLELLRSWREVRPCDAKLLFTTLIGGPLDSRYVRAMVKRYATNAGIQKDVNPHTLRHTFATDLYRQTHDLYLTGKMLGHADISTTTIYTHLVDEDAECAMKALRPNR
jgi:integrase/recombinase XerD